MNNRFPFSSQTNKLKAVKLKVGFEEEYVKGNIRIGRVRVVEMGWSKDRRATMQLDSIDTRMVWKNWVPSL